MDTIIGLIRNAISRKRVDFALPTKTVRKDLCPAEIETVEQSFAKKLDFVSPVPRPVPSQIRANPRRGVYIIEIPPKEKIPPLLSGVLPTSDLESGSEVEEEGEEEEEEEGGLIYVAQRDTALFRYAISYETVINDRSKMLIMVENTEHKPYWQNRKNINLCLGSHEYWSIDKDVVSSFNLSEAHLLAKGMSLARFAVGWQNLPSWAQEALLSQDLSRPDMFLMEQSLISSMFLFKELCDKLDPEHLPKGYSEVLSQLTQQLNRYEKYLSERISDIPTRAPLTISSSTTTTTTTTISPHEGV